ncbi:hypothetical protein OHS70_20485 [Streptomyces sp. NBC_00390]
MADHGDETSRPEQRSRIAYLNDAPSDHPSAKTSPGTTAATHASRSDERLPLARREFAVLLSEFRRAAVLVPMLPGPAGVALDTGSDGGMLFPPAAGVVPDAVAADLGGTV